MSEEDALRWGGEVAQALQVAHENRVVHRDVKPANVFLKRGDVAVLCDFGIARASGGATALTSEGVLLGTPAYMSPELWRGHPPTPASDQWAWAASLFELLYGQTPYPGETPREIMEQALDGRTIVVPSGFQGRRPALQEVLLRALAPTPGERYPDMAAFAEALREASRGSLQDVLERSGVGPLPGLDTSRETRVLLADPAATQEVSSLDVTPTRVAGEPTRIPRWVLVIGASVFMTMGILWPSGDAGPPPPSAAPSPAPREPESPRPVAAPPEVLERLAPLRRDLLGASRELRRMAGNHASEPIPDRLLRLTFQPTERMSAVDPSDVGALILLDTDHHHHWKTYLEAAGAWLRALGREQAASEVDLLADPNLIATIDSLVYQPVLRILEAAHMYFVSVELEVDMGMIQASESFRALGPPFEDLLVGVRGAWERLPPAIANVEDLGHVLGRFHWRRGPDWDGTDRRQLLSRLVERVREARPDMVGAMTMRLAMYHLCLIAKSTDATWASRDEALTAIAAKLVGDPAWQPPSFPAEVHRGLLGRLVIEEIRQRRVLDAPPRPEGHPERRTEEVFAAFEARWEEDPMVGFYVGAMGWDLARYAGGPGFFNQTNNRAVRPWKNRLEVIRNQAHRRARPGTDVRGDRRR